MRTDPDTAKNKMGKPPRNRANRKRQTKAGSREGKKNTGTVLKENKPSEGDKLQKGG